jgi:hypothetical protein
MKQVREVFSQAMSVEPEPPNRSRTLSPAEPYFSKHHSARAIGFCVGWQRFSPRSDA